MEAPSRDAEFDERHDIVLEKCGYNHIVDHIEARVRERSRGAGDGKGGREWKRYK